MIVLHCLKQAEWDALAPGVPYGETRLAAEGFLHCSDLDTFRCVAPNFRDERDALVLLCIDTSRLNAPVKWEDGDRCGTSYPHIYGLVPREAVVSVLPYLRDAAGEWRPNPELSGFPRPAEIRELFPGERFPALALAWEVFMQFEAPDYPPEGAMEFARFLEWDAAGPSMRHWGAFAEGELVGMLALRATDHISMLFVRKSHHRRGVARMLVRTALRECREAGAAGVSLHSSPYGREAYRRLGFFENGPERMENGIRYVPMEYRLESE